MGRSARGGSGYRLLDSRVTYESRIFRVLHERSILPNGTEFDGDVIRYEPAVSVVPLLRGPDGRSTVVLVEQFRHAPRGVLLEVPSGVVEAGETPAACAVRELEEETGYRAGRVEPLMERIVLPGTSPHRLHFFLATDLQQGRQQLDDVECITVRHVDLEELVTRLLEDGDAGSDLRVDLKTHLALLHCWLLLQRRGGVSP